MRSRLRIYSGAFGSMIETIFARAKVFGIIIIAFSSTALAPNQGRAFLAPPGTEPIASAAAYAACILSDSQPGHCAKVAFIADPPAPGVTGIFITIGYNSSEFTFDRLGSGFLCQFSYFVCHYRKSFPGFSCTSCFNSCV